jgi:hypothetical protein
MFDSRTRVQAVIGQEILLSLGPRRGDGLHGTCFVEHEVCRKSTVLRCHFSPKVVPLLQL